MSSSLSSIEHIGYEVDREREGQAERVAQSVGGMDNSAQGTGIRSKLRRFWKRTRIPSIVKKVVEGSKSLLSLLAPRQTPDATPPEPVQNGDTNAEPRVERVKFPEDMIPSPASSSNAASPYASVSVPHLNIHLTTPAPPSPPIHDSTTNPTGNDPVTAEQPTPFETGNEKSFGDFRYKENLVKQKSFPEIKFGVVSCRVKWLEPLLSGEKADDKNSSRKEHEILRDASGSKMEYNTQALEIHASSGLPLGIDTRSVESVLNSSEPDDESVFDDSPRLFRHRLPEEEPEPWVEPGTVTKGARWLQPIMSGEKRTGSWYSDQGNPKSPTRIANGSFR